MRNMTVSCYAAGVIGSSFAVNFAMKGFQCNVFVTNKDRKQRGAASIKHIIDSLKGYGVLSDKDEADIYSRIMITTDPALAFRDVSLIQENGPENLEEKNEIVQIVDKYAPGEAVFASSTSSMSITDIAVKSIYPERCIGAHPFNPPHLIPLVEITKGKKTAQQYVSKAVNIYRVAGKEPVVLNKEKPGFIANRLSHVVLREVMALVTEGVCSLEDADRALTFGPGLRWAAIGQGMVGELSSPGGTKEGTKRFKAINERIFKDIENLVKVPENWGDIAEAGVARIKAEMPEFVGHTTPEIAIFRDKVIIELLKLHHKLD